MSFVFQRNGTLWRAATTPPLAIRSPGVHRSLATLVRSAVRPLRTAQAVHCASPCSNFKRNLSITPRRWASAASPQTSSDPAEVEALQCLEEGTQKLEDGDVEGAQSLYKRSVEIKKTARNVSTLSLFNLGVTHYHLKQFDEAISVWKESIELQPSSPDAHTNLASAYIISPVARPDLAIHHLQIATTLAPEDPEIAFNLAAVLEACGRLEDALTYYKRSKEFGVERAAMHIRNVSAKLLGQTLKAQGPPSDGKSEPSNP